MSIQSLSYREWSGHLRSPWLTCWVIARTGAVLVLRRKMFWCLLGLALVNFLFTFALVYLKAELTVKTPQLSPFLDRVLVTGAGRMYRDFMFAQGTVTMLLLVFAGSMLVGSDYSQGGLTFYLSRRMSRRHYIVGKLLAIGLLVSLITTVPALVLYAEYGLLTDSLSYFRENIRILFGILGYGAVLAVVLSLLIFALASWIQKAVPLVMSWAALFVFLPAVGAILREVYDDRRWRLLILWRDIRLLGSWCFGALDSEQDLQFAWWSLWIVLGLCLCCLIVSVPRVRAVEVVQ